MNARPVIREVARVSRTMRLALDIAREERALRRAAKVMPTPVPWDWAAPRLIPIIAGPIIDPPGERCVRVRSDLGPMVEIGLDLGSALTMIDTRVAERWECSPDQLMERATSNLRERATGIALERVETGVMSGRELRILRDRPRWAASVLLAPEALHRLFGSHDQVLAAPSADCLLSLPIDSPSLVVADIVVDFEGARRRPLWLEPFALSNGELHWTQAGDEDAFADAEW